MNGKVLIEGKTSNRRIIVKKKLREEDSIYVVFNLIQDGF